MEAGASLGADGDGNYTSPLPAIGVEALDDVEGSGRNRFLGGGAGECEITQDMVTAWTALTEEQRMADGIIVTATVLTALQAMLTASGGEPIHAGLQKHLFETTINVSLWAHEWEVARTVYNILKGLLLRAEFERFVAHGRVSGQMGLYNFEFGRILFGAEFTMTGTKMIQLLKVDDSVAKVTAIEEVWPENRKMDPIHPGLGISPKTIGE
jgi:hypothetical protein